jgi:MFS family permease
MGLVKLSAQPAAIPRDEPGTRRWSVLVVVCVSALIINLDSTILNVALPTLLRKLHATSSELQWIVDSYAMVFAGLLLVGRSLADRFGRKRAFSSVSVSLPVDRSAQRSPVQWTC